MDRTWVCLAKKLDRQLLIHQQHILHGVTFFLAAIMAFLLSRIFGTLDASIGAIMAKRGELSGLCAPGSTSEAAIGRSSSGSTGGAAIVLSANRCAKCSIERAGASPSLLNVVCKTGNNVWIH